MFRKFSSIILASMIILSSGASPVTAQTISLDLAKAKEQERYQASIKSCEWGYRSRQSSRNYQEGKTRASVDLSYQRCLEIERNRHQRNMERIEGRAATSKRP